MIVNVNNGNGNNTDTEFIGMSYTETEGPASKKRRFSPENHNSPSDSQSQKNIEPIDIKSIDIQTTSHRDSGSENGLDAGQEIIEDDGTLTQEARVFDQNIFESFIGHEVTPSVLQRIREASGDNLERAINIYLDDPCKQEHNSGDFDTTNGIGTRTLDLSRTSPKSIPGSRYIGAFGVGGWATRSGLNLIKHGEIIRIERQKIQSRHPSSTKDSKSTSNMTSQVPRLDSAAARRVDVVVRFNNSRGEEVGRLPRETANWVSTLIDQQVCKFEGSCVYTPERIRTNDTIFIQIRCALLKNAFNKQKFKQADNRTTGVFDQKETMEERDLRLRQIALVKLFEEINLLPSRSSETTANHRRQGLLQAAEVAEQYDKEESRHSKNPAENGASSPPSEVAEEGKELEQDQLDALYRKAQSFDFDAPQAVPANTFAMNLRPYQKQALYWMMAKEMDRKTEVKDVSMHPLWEEYLWPLQDMDDRQLPRVEGQEAFYVNPYSGELSLDFPVQEQCCLGGILADEMGLGKTIEMMSLIHSHKSDVASRLQRATPGPASVNSLRRLPTNSTSVERAPCTTLVVAPMSLLAQWHGEALNASKDGTLKTMIYYGDDKSANLQGLCCEANAASAPNVIITSYGVVLSEFNQVAARGGDRGSYGGLYSLSFFRVILDEAHHIKNRQSKTAKACFEIDAKHRWVLTGTPIVNRLEDLFSLVRFLRVEPWSNFSFWKTFITVPFESKDFMRALDVVQTVLEPLVLRRTKDMKTPSGEALVPLPPKTIDIVEIELSKPERDVYEHIFTRAKRTLAANMEAGTVMKAYTSIFAQILRLRQSCCHPILTRNQNVIADEEEATEAGDAAKGLADDVDLQSLIGHFTSATDNQSDTNAFGAHVLEQIRDEAANECPICSEEPMIEQTVTGCWHSACKACIVEYISRQAGNIQPPRCFSCREAVDPQELFEVVKHEERDVENGKQKITLQRLGLNSSAKIGALLSHLKALKRNMPRTKSVVFSQFTSFLSLIEPALTRASIPFLRLDGSMSQKSRAAVLSSFASSREGIVLLLSLRAGGVGLNLTMAKRVYMMDPWWSFAIEAQAIDRVHRMGQEDEVKVFRFIVKDSVEERMLKIQDRKKFIASSLGMMSDEEKTLQRIEDIKELLS